MVERITKADVERDGRVAAEHTLVAAVRTAGELYGRCACGYELRTVVTPTEVAHRYHVAGAQWDAAVPLKYRSVRRGS